MLDYESPSTVVEVTETVENLKQGHRIIIESGVHAEDAPIVVVVVNIHLISDSRNKEIDRFKVYIVYVKISYLQLHRRGMVSVTEGPYMNGL